MRNAPSVAPTALPFPPTRLAPPTTAAAITYSSYPCASPDEAEP